MQKIKTHANTHTHLTRRTCGKRHPAQRQATTVSEDAFFSADNRGPSTKSFVQRGHLLAGSGCFSSEVRGNG